MTILRRVAGRMMKSGYWELKNYLELRAATFGLRGVWGVYILAAGFLGVGCAKNAPEHDRAVATRVLAEYVAKTAQPKGVLVISNPFTQQEGRAAEVYAFEKAGVAGLKEGFGERGPMTVVFPKLKAEVLRDPGSVQVDPQTTTPLSFLMAENAFSEVIQQNPNCNLVVSLIGLPVNLGGVKEWSQAGGPKFALLLPDWRMIGGREEILRAFREKRLVAAVVNKPNAVEGAGNNYKEQFENRFLLVTEENVEGLLRDAPEVFELR